MIVTGNNLFKQSSEESSPITESNTIPIGENEDDDVKAERQKVKSMINSHNVAHPVVMVHVMHKLFCHF